MILNCVARFCCVVKVVQKKVFTLVGLYTKRLNASADASASAFGHQINVTPRSVQQRETASARPSTTSS